jgi:tRNA pseudouridine38-40 synthase
VRNLKLTIEYDGTSYAGWQTQAGRPTIQQTLEDAVHRITGERVHVQGSGRTDSGVHALGQAANFRTHAKIPAAKLRLALNALLPPDIVVRSVREAPPDFHAQFDAKWKTYRYTILNDRVPTALDRFFCHQVPVPLDVRAMRRAARGLVGRHDFQAFRSEGWREKDTVRTIRRLTIARKGRHVHLTVEGNGFLYNMVRAIAGTLIVIGRGKRPPEDMQKILASRDRKQAGPTAPARGLCLITVKY